MNLRKADGDDCWDVFKWINDPYTRAMFFSSKEVTRNEHWAWFNQTIVKDDSEIYMIEDEDRKVGTLHVHKVAIGWEVSINIAPEERRKGYAVKALKELANLYPDLVAHIKLDNVISQKTFEEAGFKRAYYGYRRKGSAS